MGNELQGRLLGRRWLEALQREEFVAESWALCAAGGCAASADDYSSVTYRWDEDYLNEKYEMLTLKVIHRRRRTGFEESKDIAIQVNDLIAGRYQVTSRRRGVFYIRCCRELSWCVK